MAVMLSLRYKDTIFLLQLSLLAACGLSVWRLIDVSTAYFLPVVCDRNFIYRFYGSLICLIDALFGYLCTIKRMEKRALAYPINRRKR